MPKGNWDRIGFILSIFILAIVVVVDHSSSKADGGAGVLTPATGGPFGFSVTQSLSPNAKNPQVTGIWIVNGQGLARYCYTLINQQPGLERCTAYQ